MAKPGKEEITGSTTASFPIAPGECWMTKSQGRNFCMSPSVTCMIFRDGRRSSLPPLHIPVNSIFRSSTQPSFIVYQKETDDTNI